MPQWVQFVLIAAALVAALGTLWQKVFLPGFRAANRADRLIDTVTKVETLLPALEDIAQILPVVRSMATQFKSDSGSTLKDQINGLEAAVERMESDRIKVAVALEKATRKIELVAADLEASRSRADVVGPGHQPGTASDAAARHDPNDVGGGE